MKTNPASSPRIEWTSESVSGTKKPVNDDSCLAFASDLNGATLLEKSGSRCLASQDLIFGVCDGMGGGKAGDTASDLMLRILCGLIPETFEIAASGRSPDYLNHLDETIRDIHEAINRTGQQGENKQGMAATLILAWFTREKLYFANVGDSRLYLYRRSGADEKGQGEMYQLSPDHAVVWHQMKRGEISERQYRAHPRRSALYEVVGGGHPTVNPYMAAVPYQVGDRFLLCSDGLIDGLWQKHIHSAFETNPGSTEALAQALLSRAVSNAGTDDTTLITLAVRESEQ